MYALGLWHTQSRQDSDGYAKIIWGNIQQVNAVKLSSKRVIVLGKLKREVMASQKLNL